MVLLKQWSPSRKKVRTIFYTPLEGVQNIRILTLPKTAKLPPAANKLLILFPFTQAMHAENKFKTNLVRRDFGKPSKHRWILVGYSKLFLSQAL